MGNYYDEAASQQSFNSASGNEILLDGSSSNVEKDKSSLSTEIKSGSAVGYHDVTGSGYSGSSLHAGGGFSITSGDRIKIQASTFDIAGDKASVSADVENGAITGTTMFAETAYASQLSASQTAQSTTGNKLMLDAIAKSATNPKVQKDSTVIDPNTAFHNTASVTSGTSNIDQGTP